MKCCFSYWSNNWSVVSSFFTTKLTLTVVDYKLNFHLHAICCQCSSWSTKSLQFHSLTLPILTNSIWGFLNSLSFYMLQLLFMHWLVLQINKFSVFYHLQLLATIADQYDFGDVKHSALLLVFLSSNPDYQVPSVQSAISAIYQVTGATQVLIALMFPSFSFDFKIFQTVWYIC